VLSTCIDGATLIFGASLSIILTTLMI